MSKIRFSDCVRHLYVPKINKVKNLAPNGLRTWLTVSDHYIVTDSGETYVEITYYDEMEVLETLAKDVSRLSCASLESISNVIQSQVLDKSVAWNLIQYYYAAFYSAHSMWRLLGFGLVQLDAGIIGVFSKKCLANSIILSNKVSKGIYCMQIDLPTNKLILYRVGRYDDSHKGLWKRFYEVLGLVVGEYVSTNTYGNDCLRVKGAGDTYPLSLHGKIENTDAFIATERIDQLKDVINRNRDCNWLSSVRNEINYSHGLGSWYPYKYLSRDYKQIVSLKGAFVNDFISDELKLDDEDKLVLYVKTCQLINSLNYDLLLDLKDRNPEAKSFLNKEVFKFVNIMNEV